MAEGFLESLSKKVITKDNFVTAFKAVLKHLARLEEKLTKKTDEQIEAKVAAALQRIESKTNQEIARLQQIERGKDGKTPVKGVDYFDGKTPVKGVDYNDGEPGIDGAIDTGAEIVVKINEKANEKKIKKEKVEGLAEIEEIARIARSTVSSLGLRMAGDSVFLLDLSAQTNGSSKTFDISSTNFRTPLLVLMSDAPYILMNGNGFSATQALLTLSVANAPSQGSQLGLLYVI